MITLGGLISRRRLSTFSTLFPQYHLYVLCFVLNQRPRSCLTTPRNTQCMVSIAIPLTTSKLGSCNKGLGALKPQTYKTYFKVRITCTYISQKNKCMSSKAPSCSNRSKNLWLFYILSVSSKHTYSCILLKGTV